MGLVALGGFGLGRFGSGRVGSGRVGLGWVGLESVWVGLSCVLPTHTVDDSHKYPSVQVPSDSYRSLTKGKKRFSH